MSATGNARPLLAAGLFLLTWAMVFVPFEVRALWPSVLAVATVLLLRRALFGLLLGALAGAVMLAHGNPLTAFTAFFAKHLLPALQSEWNLCVLLFTLLLGGFAALLEHGGGFQALFRRWLDGAGDRRRRVQWSAFGLGLVCFFDGLANSLLVGKTIRPLADHAGVSRAKLAYLVDSTSSAVACVAIMSTWIAYQLSMIREGHRLAGLETVNPFGVFLRSIPLNFYCWFTLILLAVVIWKNWNPGPMAAAEAAARPVDGSPDSNTKTMAATAAGSSARALVPLLFLLLGLPAGLYWNGAEGGLLPVSFARVMEAFGRADAAKVLLHTSVLAGLVAFAANARAIARRDNPEQVFLNGMLSLFAPCLILIAAWTLSSTLKELGAARVLSELLVGRLPAFLFPAGVFLAGMAISFTTGTSWGTMGVLMPLALPVAIAFHGPDHALVSATVAAVFSGAVFGDHCSPLSDTTIVSSLSCDLEPTEHVRTQLPYALTAAALALLLGFLPAGLGVPGWIALAAGAGIITFVPEAHYRWLSSKAT